jgi:Chaperone of endosialidase
MIDFPASPVLNQIFKTGNYTYKWDGSSWLSNPPNSAIPDAPNDGLIYGRQSKAWVSLSGAQGFVLKAGDAMTGPLSILMTGTPFNATLTLSKNAEGNSTNIFGQAAGANRWALILGNGAAGGVSDFNLLRYSNVGASTVAMTIPRATGGIQIEDGTVAAPAYSFISEPGLGFYRGATGQFQGVAGGVQTFNFYAGTTNQTALGITPRVAGSTWIDLFNAPAGAANYNLMDIRATPTSFVIQEQMGGTATAQPLTMTFPGGMTFNATAGFAINVSPPGNTQINGVDSIFNLNKTGAANYSIMYGKKNNVARWYIALGDATAESGGNAGSNFVISNHTDAGAGMGAPLIIYRSSSQANFAVAIVNGPSDRALKDNIAPIDNALAKVLALQGVSFNMIATPEHREIGFIANDVQPVVPEVIQRYDDKHLALDYPKMTALLVEAVKTLNARLEAIHA